MIDTALKFERVYIEKPKLSGEQKISYILSVCNMIPVLKYACDKNIPELLHEGPKSVEEIATAIDGQAIYLHRLLRAMSAIGFFTYNPQSKLWSNSNQSELFLSDYKVIIHQFENALIRPLRRLLPIALEQDKTIFEVAGVATFDFSNP